jgi:tetrahydromethanopterin S-methyltransferase subunit H
MKFKTKQRTFTINNINMGGQPGELPTVLIGSIFYEGHKIVKDASKGVFDKEEAERLMKLQDEMSEKTGNPCMVDIVGLNPEAMKRYIDFVASTTDAPILIDSSSWRVKTSALKHAAEVGLLDRVIYNSISYNVKSEEIAAIKETGLKAAVLLAHNPRNPLATGRIEALRGKEGILQIAKRAGIEKPLIDVGVLDVPSIGLAAEAIRLVKREFGLPAGGAPLNAVLEWRRLRELSEYADKTCAASSAAVMQIAGANFLLYGPIAKSVDLFPTCAMVDAIIAYVMRRRGIKPKAKSHPLYKIF